MNKKYDVTGMTCSACSAHVEKAVNALPGVNEVNVNLLRNSMSVDFDESELTSEDIEKAVTDAGYGATPKNTEKKTLIDDPRRIKDQEIRALKNRLIVSLCFLAPLLYISMGHMLGAPLPSFLTGVENSVSYAMFQFILTLPIIYINRPFFIVGFKSLFRFAPNMDSLVAIGSSAAIVYGIYAIIKIGQGLGTGNMAQVEAFHMDLYFESAGTILTLITVGKFLEARSKGRTSDAIEKLMDLTPKTAITVRNGNEVTIPVEEVSVGDILIVKPGSSVPVDGIVTDGSAAIDESMITGESLPRDKQKDDDVTGGTVNKSGFFRMEARRVGEDTTLSQIVQLVEDANSSKAPIAKLADKVSGVFVPIVIAIAIISTVVWLFLGHDFDFALSIGIAVLVISCPCALGLATPTAIMVGTGKGAEYGILYKSAESLERMHKIDTIILDKTGTVTEGKISVTEMDIGKADKINDDMGRKFDEALILTYLYSLEKLSEHPIAGAVVDYAESKGIKAKETADFKMIEGQGIAATIDGILVAAGNRRLMEENDMEDSNGYFLEAGKKMSRRGETPLFVSLGDEIAGVIGLKDRIKDGSREAIQNISKAGIDIMMITGDNRITAQAIADDLGIKSVLAEVLPRDKENEVKKIQDIGKKVAMVGDGINDSPALARADIGIAIGAGTDIAIESADIVLVKSDLRDVMTAIELSNATIRNIKQNLFWAFIYNIIGIPLAAGILYIPFGLKLSPMFAAAAMSLSSFFVVTNALRLRLFKSE